MRLFYSIAILAALSITFIAAPARADTDHRLALVAGDGIWLQPESGMHVLLLVAYDIEGLPGGTHFGAEYNTDTLRLKYDGWKWFDGKLEAGVAVSYEYKFAGLLIDYYRQGQKDSARGFNAGYLEASAFLKIHLSGHHHLSLTAGARRWFFTKQSTTSSALILPPETWVIEPRLNYTYWNLQSDPSLRDRHRLFTRARGWALGFELGVDWRSQTRPWGALDPAAFDVVDPRNDPEYLIVRARQCIRAVCQLHNRLMAQIAQSASWGHGEDDLTRVRLGGSNPYVVPLAGAPWAAFLSEKFLALESSWHIAVWEGLELGPLFQAALIEDTERLGREDTYGTMASVGLFVDWQLGDFQIDLRGGWSPTLDDQDSAGQFGIFVAGGWQWD